MDSVCSRAMPLPTMVICSGWGMGRSGGDGVQERVRGAGAGKERNFQGPALALTQPQSSDLYVPPLQ